MVPAQKHGERATASSLTIAQRIASFFHRHRNGHEALPPEPPPETKSVLVQTPRGLERIDVPAGTPDDWRGPSPQGPERPRLQLREEESTQASPRLQSVSKTAFSEFLSEIKNACRMQKLVDASSTGEISAFLDSHLSKVGLEKHFAMLDAAIPEASKSTSQDFLKERRLLLMLKFDSSMQNPLELMDRAGLENLLKTIDAALADNALLARLDALSPVRSGFFSRSAKQRLTIVRSTASGLLFAKDESRLESRMASTVTLHTGQQQAGSPLTQHGLLEVLSYTPPGEKLDKPVAPSPEMEIPNSKLPKPHASEQIELGAGGLRAALQGQPARPKGVDVPAISEPDASAGKPPAYASPELPPQIYGGLQGALTGFDPAYAIVQEEQLPLPPSANESTVRRTPELGEQSLLDILQGKKPSPEPPRK